MSCKGWRLVAWGIALVGAVPFCLGFFSGNFWGNPLSWVGLLLLAASAVVGAWKFRCPHCGDYMGVGRYQPGHSCRRCGHTLEKSREPRARQGDRLTAAGDALRS